MRRRAFLLLAGCVALSGCDTVNGVVRTADLAEPFTPDCMRRVILATPGVLRLRYGAARKGALPPFSFVYGYDGAPEANIKGVVQVARDGQGRLRYRNSLTYINAVPVQAEIDATRPVMQAMEQRLAADCGFATAVQESCTNVACAPL